jgi:hypothetical protein
MSERFQQGRWSLVVEFDDWENQDNCEMDEAFAFSLFVGRTFGGLWEELREIMKWEKGTRQVEVSSNMIDYLAKLMEWIMYHTIPKQVELKRNGNRV